jgi:glycosyltransferase involved in cell wall biosynthesis
MIQNKTVAVVVPAYNEEQQIGKVIAGIPDFADRIIVVNDASTDATAEVVSSLFEKTGTRTLPEAKEDTFGDYGHAGNILRQMNEEELQLFSEAEVVHPAADRRLVLINLKKNSGVGAAIARGYKYAKDLQIDCTAVMAGDGQMDPAELEKICRPVIEENVDYVKGNRLRHRGARRMIPRTRFFGNSVLSILTKIASGYWRVSDTQTGYTAISKNALNLIDLYDIYPRYGMPNDLLVKLNIVYCTIKEVNINPVYGIGEKSKMRPHKIVLPVTWLLIKSFFKRMWQKYLFTDFHPLFILYHFGIILLLIAFPYLIKILRLMILGIPANPVTVMAFVFLFISGSQSLLFAMWMDIIDNERLYK